MVYDVIIIGNGPAGISASLYTKRSGLNTLIIGNNNSDLLKAKEIENYYGFSKPISGKILLESGLNQAKNLGIPVLSEEVVGIKYEETFIVKTSENEYSSKTIILATGTKRSKTNIKGIKEYEGKGISYCAVCDGFFHKNKNVAVIGNGEYAISEALELAQIANNVTILTNGGEYKEVRNPKIKFDNRRIKEVRGNENKLETIEFEDNSLLNISGVFVAEGAATSTDLARKIGLELEEKYIKVSENMSTNIPGIFACGDCTGGLMQISKAVYEGTKAGLAIAKYLKK